MLSDRAVEDSHLRKIRHIFKEAEHPHKYNPIPVKQFKT